MKQKLLYESPSAELLVVRFEGNVMSPGVTVEGDKGDGYGDSMYYLDDDE